MKKSADDMQIMALLPPRYLDSIVAIGSAKNNIGPVAWGATGFMVGRPSEKENAVGQYVFLITNKHVLEGRESVVVRFNPKKGREIKDYQLRLIDVNREIPQRWIGHPRNDIDIAALPLHGVFFQDDGQEILPFAVSALMTKDDLVKEHVAEGDFVYILGYPMGLLDPDWRYPIARSGIIARIQDLLDGHKSKFLLDAYVSPGNSGGPVILKPERIAIEGTAAPKGIGVIGIISSSYMLRERHRAPHRKLRTIDTQNSGLASVFPSDFILETIDETIKKTRGGPNPTSIYLP